MNPAPPLIVIAAGGEGRRIGGHKPAQTLAGRRLIDFAAQWARQQSPHVMLSVQPGQDDWGTNMPCIADRHDRIGPISALARAMQAGAAGGHDHVLLIGCDMPFLPDDLIARLAAALPGHGAALPVSAGRIHPMAGLWRTNALDLATWIADGGRSPGRYAETIGVARVVWAQDPDPFFNVNDMAALAIAEDRIKSAAASP